MKIRRFNENEDPTNKIFDLLDSPDISNRELGFKLISTQEIKSKKLTELIGKTFNSVYMNNGKDEIYFCSNEKNYIFYHEQDCCESVCVEDIDGDLEDLANTPIINAEEITKIDINNDDSSILYNAKQYAKESKYSYA